MSFIYSSPFFASALQFAFEKARVVDVVLMGNQVLWEAMQEKDRLLALDDLTDQHGMRLRKRPLGPDPKGTVGAPPARFPERHR